MLHLLQNDLSTDVLGYRNLIPVAFIAAEHIKGHVTSQARIFVPQTLHNSFHWCATVQSFVVLSNDGIEDCPHYFWEVDIPAVVSDIETVNDLVQFFSVDLKGFVAKRRRQGPHEVRELVCFHVVLALGVEVGPSFKEYRDISFLQ